jgi:hypothetical protein
MVSSNTFYSIYYVFYNECNFRREVYNTRLGVLFYSEMNLNTFLIVVKTSDVDLDSVRDA